MTLAFSDRSAKATLRPKTVAGEGDGEAVGALGLPEIEMNGEEKCEWLRSRIVGGEAEFDGPFGRRRITYSDHTASGRFLDFVEEFLQRDVLPFYGNTHTQDSYVGRHTTDLVNRSVQYVKQTTRTKPGDILLFCGSGSTAAIKRLQEVMGIAVPSVLRPLLLRHLPPVERWVVFVGPYEHHSNLLSWRQSLAQVVEVGLDESGRIDLPELERAVGSSEFVDRPKLGSFSACSNVTGIQTDTQAIARLLHRYGSYACFDFACSGPYVDIDMKSGQSDGYDAVFLSPHKFLGGPGSPGILLMTSQLYKLRSAPPSTSGGGTVRFVGGYDADDTVYCDDPEEREDAGTPAIVQKIRAAAAFRVKDWVGRAAIRKRERRMMRAAMRRMVGNSRVRVLGAGATGVEDLLPITSILLYPVGMKGKHLHCRFVATLLNDLFGIQARGGCSCAGPYGHSLLGIDRNQSKAIKSAVKNGFEGVKPGWTRVSFPYYTSNEEMEFVLDAIELLAEVGHRFLSLYSFDWKTGDWKYLHQERTLQEVAFCDKNDSYINYIATAKSFANSEMEMEMEMEMEKGRDIPACIDPNLVSFWI